MSDLLALAFGQEVVDRFALLAANCLVDIPNVLMGIRGYAASRDRQE